MTDRPEKPAKDIEGPGVHLRRARQARGMSLRDIAQELHLDEWMLQALEEDDFAALGAPVFTKGHMRKYGIMLGLDADDLMIAYYRKRGRDDSPPPITKMMAPESPGRELNWLSVSKVLLFLIIGIVIFLIWSILTRGVSNPQSSVPVIPPSGTQLTQNMTTEFSSESLDELADLTEVGVSDQQTDSETVATVERIAERSAEQGDSVVVALPVRTTSDPVVESGGVNNIDTATSPQNEPVTAADNFQVVPPVEIRLRLTGESWVEVTDSDGTRLVYDMLKDGRVRTVSGRPPIEVFLGLSRAVEVEVDGQSYSIPRTAIRGNTARFVIGSNTP